MDDPKLRQLITEYMKNARLMQLTTSSNNQPWACSVWFGFDENLNIYWFSSTNRRHSKEIAANNKVAGAIVIPQTPEDIPRGVQFQGTAELLEKKEDVEKAMSVYVGKIFSKETVLELMEDYEHPHKFYRVRPSLYVLFDMVSFPENSRRELVL